MSINSLVNNPQIIDELKLIFGGSTSVVSATLPLVVASNDVSLPISGVWSGTNNVLKSSSSTVLEWGSDATSPAPVIVTTNYTTIANIYFNSGFGSTNINSVTYSDINSKSATYSQVSSFPFQATAAIVPSTGATCGFLLNIDFPIIAGMKFPASVQVGFSSFGATIQIGNTSLTPLPPYQVPLLILFDNLTCAALDNVTVLLSQFTLVEGM